MNAFSQQRSTHGLGASEVAAAIGLNPYRTPFELWLEKTGQVSPQDENEAMRWGLLLEGTILDEYARRCEPGVTIERCEQSVFSAETSFARATPDAWRHEGGMRTGVVQAKNIGARGVWQWKDSPPDMYTLQVQWELYVTGLQRGDLAALLGGNELRVYTVWRDDALIADLVRAAAAFWRHVETRTPPPADESGAAREYWASRTGSAVLENDADVNTLTEQLRAAKTKAREAKYLVETFTNQIVERLALAGASAAKTPYGVLTVTRRRGAVSWKRVAESAGLTSFGEQFRSDDTHYLRTPREWSQDDDE